MFQTKVVEKVKTHVFYASNFLNRAVYGLMWKEHIESRRPQMTIWRMCSLLKYQTLQAPTQNI
jgi:hypothetical protein